MVNRIVLAVIFTVIYGSILNAQKVDTVYTDSVNLAQQITPKGDVREPHPIATAYDLENKDFVGSWPMFGSDLRMKIGGYVKVDFVYDLNGTRDKTQFLMSSIPVEGEPDYGGNPYTNFFAKETRFNIDIRTNKVGIPIRAFLEADFFTTNGEMLRLRHAYITAGNFTIGKYWTTLSFLESLPFLIDFAAGDALFGGRAVQIRYKQRINDNLSLSIGIEQLSNFGIQNPNNFSGQASSLLPLLAVKGEYRKKYTAIFWGGSVAQLRWDGGPNTPVPTALQYNLVVAGRQYLGENNYITWNFSFGEGSGENIMAFIGSDANAVLETSSSLRTMRSTSAVIGFVHKWSKSLSSNFSYAYGWLIDIPDTREPFSLQDGGVSHLNLIWRHGKHFSTGVEYMWGSQRASNDALGSASRFQFMSKFDF